MYNKLFTKILDSSIWLEPETTRIVWLTFIAVMDEDGFAQFASVANLAHRARVGLEACEKAVETLQSPDINSSDPDHEGRRIERVNGGWMILNSDKYRDIVTREMAKKSNRERVARFRKKNKTGSVTVCNGLVMQSDTDTETEQYRGEPPKAPNPLIVSDSEEPELFDPPAPAKLNGSAVLKLIVDYWNSKLGLVSVSQISPSRSGRLRRRLSDPAFAAGWKAAIDRVASSQFCRGNNDRGWRADFDWFLDPAAFEKINAGRYDKKSKHKTDFDPKTEDYDIKKSPF